MRNYFLFLFIYIFTLTILRRRGTSGRGRCCQPQKIANATMGHKGLPAFLLSVYRTKITCILEDSTGFSTAHSHRDPQWDQRQGENIVICFTQPIRHGGDRLHLAKFPTRCCTPRPMVVNRGVCNIRDVRGFGLPQ